DMASVIQPPLSVNTFIHYVDRPKGRIASMTDLQDEKVEKQKFNPYIPSDTMMDPRDSDTPDNWIP
ncbi:4494_t:CDS:1, partial [Dentiscutata heterogama]